VSGTLSLSQDQAAKAVARLRDSRIFIREVLGLTTMVPDQLLLLDAFEENRRIAVTAGQGTGKSWLESAMALAFLYSRQNSKVVVISSDYGQIQNVLFPQIREMFKAAKVALGGTLLQESIRVDDNWFAIGKSTDESVRLQGIHASGGVLVILDEATGIAPPIFEVAEAITVGPEDRLVAMGNPTDVTSRFFEECEKPGKWKHIEISCLTHPNVLTGENIIPGAVTREWVDSMRRDYGENHPVWEARVLGRWSRRLGKMFTDFDDAIGGRHIYRHGTVTLDEWLPTWIGMDWGYAHDSAIYWFKSDGKDIWIVDELVTAEKTPGQLGRMVGERSEGQKIEMVALSHEALNRTEGPKSRGTLMAEEWRPMGLPFPTRASTDRIGGWNLMTQLLRTDRLHISSRCVKLIQGLKKAIRDPDKPEDLLKGLGDDYVDAVRYGLMVYDKVVKVPLQERLKRAIEPAVKREDYFGAMYLRSRFAEEEKRRQKTAKQARVPKWQLNRRASKWPKPTGLSIHA